MRHSVQARCMAKERIDTGGQVFGPYSPGVKAGGVIWLAGQIEPEAGGISEQTQASLDKIDAKSSAVEELVEEVKLNIFCSDFCIGQNLSWDYTMLKRFSNG